VSSGPLQRTLTKILQRKRGMYIWNYCKWNEFLLKPKCIAFNVTYVACNLQLATMIGNLENYVSNNDLLK